MSDYRSVLERIGSRISPGPDDLDQVAKRLQRRKSRRRLGIAVFAFVIAGAGFGTVYLALFRSNTPSVIRPLSGRCEDLIPECKMARLSNRVLTGEHHLGALGPVGRVPQGIVGFDKALTQAWAQDAHPTATAVQVVLGSADPSSLHWDTTSHNFYAVTWFGVCEALGGGGAPQSSPQPPAPCPSGQRWITVIDANTGAFIVGGTG